MTNEIIVEITLQSGRKFMAELLDETSNQITVINLSTNDLMHVNRKDCISIEEIIL